MNRDFVIPATPGHARTLMKMARISSLNLDPEVVKLAMTGRVHADSFTTPQQAAIQSLVDFDFRAIFPGPMPVVVDMCLAAAKLAGIETVCILSRSPNFCSHLADKHGYVKGKTFHFLRFNDEKSTLDSDFIRENRHGLFLFDSDELSTEHLILTHSFPKSVALCRNSGLGGLERVAGVLFPESPTELLESNFFLRQELAVKGFTKTKPEDLAFMLNVITDHLGQP